MGASVFIRRLELVIAYQLRVQPGVSVSETNASVYQQVPGSPCLTDVTTCDPNLQGRPAPVINAGTYSASSHLLSLNVLYRYGM